MLERVTKWLGFSSKSPAYQEWLVIHDGETLGRLVDGRQVDMFWVRYRLEPLVDEPERLARLYSQSLWNECRFTFAREDDDHVAEGAFASGDSIEAMPERPDVSIRHPVHIGAIC